MGVAKGRKQIEKRLVDMSAAPATTDEPGWTPNLDECQEDQYPVPLGPYDQLMIRMNQDRQDRVVEFAMMQQTRQPGGPWVDVVRIDTAHGEVHEHRFTRAGGKSRAVIATITGPNVTDAAYTSAYETLLAEWNESLRRWTDCDQH